MHDPAVLAAFRQNKISAANLARKFEVSVRTIQRDIESLCQAGIPISAETGAKGGYSLTDSFCMDRQTATNEDFAHTQTQKIFQSRSFQTLNSEQKMKEHNMSDVYEKCPILENEEYLLRLVEEGAAIRFWLSSYKDRWFVRYAIVSKKERAVIGTDELFHRISDDPFTGMGVLRPDVGSAHEREGILNRRTAGGQAGRAPYIN